MEWFLAGSFNLSAWRGLKKIAYVDSVFSLSFWISIPSIDTLSFDL